MGIQLNINLIFHLIPLCHFLYNFRSPLGPSLEINSLTEAQILAEPDVERQAIMHLAQMAVYLLYSVRVQDESWLPYFKMILNTNCNALWSWSETELKELQDKALMNRAQKWHREITLLTEKIAPKLTELGLFVEGLEPKDLVSIQKKSLS